MTYEYKFPRTPPIGSANVISGTDSDDIARALKTDANGQLLVALGAATPGATTPEKAEDDASASGDVGIPAMAVQRASPADTAANLDYSMLQMSGGRLWVSATVDAALPAGTALIGKVGIDQTTPGTTNAVERVPSGIAGAGIAPVVTAALATSKVIKASAGNLHGLNCAATTVAGIFLLHNATSAPAAGAVTPIKAWPVAAGQGIDLSFDPPLRCGTGISVTFTSAATPFTQTDSATAFISGGAV